MRVAYVLLSMALWGCVSPRSHLGMWEHKDSHSFLRVILEHKGACSIFVGGKVGDVFEGIGGRCHYSETERTISITDIADFGSKQAPEQLPHALTLRYDADTDTIVVTSGRSTRLVRASNR
jgi:hypothetical protein